MRLFTAIDIPDDVKERLDLFLTDLRPFAKLNWSPVGNMHITTKFIGEWPEERLGDLKTVLAGIPKAGAFPVQLKGLGWFPNEKQARVLWAGVLAGEPLRSLVQGTNEALGSLVIPSDEREFSPHLTLARIREAGSHDALREPLKRGPMDFGSFRVSSFFLFLSRAGRYTKLAQFSLE